MSHLRIIRRLFHVVVSVTDTIGTFGLQEKMQRHKFALGFREFEYIRASDPAHSEIIWIGPADLNCQRNHQQGGERFKFFGEDHAFELFCNLEFGRAERISLTTKLLFFFPQPPLDAFARLGRE